MARILIGLLLLSISLAAAAEAETKGQAGAKFLEFNTSARSESLGGASAASGMLTEVIQNPAALTGIDGPSLFFSHSNLYQDNSLDVLAGGLYAGRKIYLGVSFLSFSMPKEPIYDRTGMDTGRSIEYNGTASGIIAAYEIRPYFKVGAAVKGISEKLVDIEDSTGASDLGAIYERSFSRSLLKVGLALNNVGGSIRPDEKLPSIFRMGASYGISDFTGYFDFWSNGVDDVNSLCLGGEYWIQDTFAPRLGLGVSGENSGLTAGFGLKWRKLFMDYSFTPERVLGVSHRFTLGADLGGLFNQESPGQKPEKEAKRAASSRKPAAKMLDISSDEQINIAVAELDGKNVSAMDAAIVSDFIRTELVRTRAFSVLDRQNMERLLEEQSFQLTGCTTEDCAVQMGKILNVKYMVVGTFSKFLETYYINVNVIDVETGQIVIAEAVECASGRELPQAAGRAAQAIKEQFGR